ncbi:MAG: EAL domain-containing protein [Nodosilinea sp.]
MRNPSSALVQTGLVVFVYALSFLALEYAASVFAERLQISYWDPSAALHVVLLLAFGLRYAPLILLAAWFIIIIIFSGEYGYWMAFLSALFPAVSYGTSCALLKHKFHIDPRLLNYRDVFLFSIIAGFAAPFLIALLRITSLSLLKHIDWADFLLEFLKDFAGESTGVMMLAPSLLLVLRKMPWRASLVDLRLVKTPLITEFRWPHRCQLAEWVLTVISLTMAVWFAFGITFGPLDQSYAIFLPLVWIAVQKGYEKAILAVLFINVASAIFVSSQPQINNAIALQFCLMAVSFLGTLLGAVVHDRREFQAQLYERATRDTLTKLHNRTWFMENLRQSLSRSQRTPEYQFAVFFLDLDRFKAINSSFGYNIGDKLLKAVGNRLDICFGPSAKISRLGGDEFTLLLEDYDTIATVRTTAQQLCERLSQRYQIDGYELYVTISVGAATSAFDYSSADDLMRDTDVALRQSKANGRSQYTLFDREMHEQTIQQDELEDDLRQTINALELSFDQSSFQVYYQPIVNIKTRQITGLEALLRWQSPRQGWVLPSKFIPVAENTGLIIPLGNWVLYQAIKQLKLWQQTFSHLNSLTIAINLSVKQLSQPGLAETITSIMEDIDLPAQNLKIELTESVFMHDGYLMEDFARSLKAAGASLSIDDFGTGYSSLRRLHSLNADIIKIDRSFVKDMAHSRTAYEIVRVIIELAHTLGMSVVAEGVETSEQAAQLEFLQCEEGQGYLFSRPLPPEAIAPLFGPSDSPVD